MTSDFSDLPNAKLVRTLISLAKENEALTCTCKGESGADQEELKSELTLVESELMRRLSFYPELESAKPLVLPDGICEEWRREFAIFADKGQGSPELLAHIKTCPGCTAATEQLFRELADRFEKFVAEVRQSEPQ